MVARKITKSPTRIWSFYAKPPITNVKRAQDLLFLGFRHYNNLIEIERDRGGAFREIRERHVPGLDAAREGFEQIESEYKAVNDEVKKSRARAHQEGKKTRAVPPELKAQYDELKARKKALWERHRELAARFKEMTEPATEEWKRRRAERAADAGPRVKERVNAEVLAEMLAEDWPEAWKDVARLDAECLRRQKTARATCGMPHGCYLLAENSAAQAVQKSRPAPPHFRRFYGGGRIGVQVTGDETFGDVLDGRSKFLRLRQVPSRGRHEEFYVVSLRVGKNEEGSPLGDALDGVPKHVLKSVGEQEIARLRAEWTAKDAEERSTWIDFPVRLHRLPPRDALLKWAWVKVGRVGGERFKYELQLTLEGDGLVRPREFGDCGSVEVRFCSQSVEGGTRVASWLCRETGEVGDVVLPKALAERLDYSAVLRSHADAHVDEVVRVLSCWTTVAGNRLTGWRRPSKKQKDGRDPKRVGKTRSEGVRVWIRFLCTDWANATVGRERLTRWWHEWRAERLAANKDLFPHLGTATRWAKAHGAATGSERLAFWLFLWALKDRHLRRTAGQQRERSEHQRDALYRQAAIDLSRQFGEFVLDASDLREQKKTPKVEEESNEFQRMRTVRQNAAPGRCRELFKEVLGPRIKVERSGDELPPGGARSSGPDAGSESSAVEYVAAE